MSGGEHAEVPEVALEPHRLAIVARAATAAGLGADDLAPSAPITLGSQ